MTKRAIVMADGGHVSEEPDGRERSSMPRRAPTSAKPTGGISNGEVVSRPEGSNEHVLRFTAYFNLLVH